MSACAGYLDASGAAVLALVHEPEGPPRGAVLLVPPFGWDEVASYRSRRAWGDALAAGGRVAMRIDLPGTGDSAGGATDDGLLDAWVAAVEAGTRWLAARGGPVAVVGTGLGGLLALLAAARGAPADELVLWAVPASGRRLVRELAAFAALEDADLGAARAERPPPEGAIEAGGFFLAAETVRALATVDLAALALPGRRRVLLLGRDGIAPDDRLRGALAAAGHAVDTGPGSGYSRMHALPHDSEPATAVMDQVARWLSAGEAAGTAPPLPVRATLADGVEEEPLCVDGPGRPFGILATRPGAPPGPCAVLLNAGAIRRSGPARLWTEAARRWAARGLSVLRLDVEGIGDAGGPDVRDPDVSLYAPAFVAQVRATLDALEERGHGPFALAGLCSGAYWALHGALEDSRVTTALLLNPRLVTWDPELVRLRAAREVLGAARGSPLRRLARGQWGLRRLGALAVRLARATRTAASVYPARLADPAPVVERIAASPARFWVAFSGDEPLAAELAGAGLTAELAACPNVVLADLPGSDHTLRPLAAQHAAHELIDRALGAHRG